MEYLFIFPILKQCVGKEKIFLTTIFEKYFIFLSKFLLFSRSKRDNWLYEQSNSEDILATVSSVSFFLYFVVLFLHPSSSTYFPCLDFYLSPI